MYKGIGIVVIVCMGVFSLSIVYKVVKNLIGYIKDKRIQKEWNNKNGFNGKD